MKVRHKYFEHHVLFFEVAKKFQLKKAKVLVRQLKVIIYTWHLVGWRFTKMVRLTLETNTFCSPRIHVQMNIWFCLQQLPTKISKQ